VKTTTRKPHVRRLGRGITLVAVLGLPVCGLYLQTAGCSSSSSNGPTTAPPGGTFGALVTVHVVGGGRVHSSPAGVDCPGSCAHSFIFDQATDGALAGVTLTAEGTAAWKFTGFTFNQVNVAGRGEGPAACQPITRPSSGPPPGVGVNAATMTLPPAEVSGTSEAEGGAFCGAYTKLPAAYDITATFVSTMPQEGGTVDGGMDGGGPDMLYDRPTSNAIGRRIFYMENTSQVLWQTDDGAQSTISYGAVSGFSHGTVATSSLISKFWGGTGAVAYQSSGSLYGVFSPYTTSTLFSFAPTCAALTADSTYAYCLGTDGTFARWSHFSPSTTIPLDNGFFNVSSLDNDPAQSFAIFSDTIGNVSRVSTTTFDGGMPQTDAGLVQVATGQLSPHEIHVANQTAYFITNTSQIVSAPVIGGGPVSTIGISHSGLTSFAVDPFESFIVAAIVPSTATGASSVIRISLPGGTTTTIRSGLTGVGGVATDGNYVFWTDITGRVFKTLVP